MKVLILMIGLVGFGCEAATNDDQSIDSDSGSDVDLHALEEKGFGCLTDKITDGRDDCVPEAECAMECLDEGTSDCWGECSGKCLGECSAKSQEQRRMEQEQSCTFVQQMAECMAEYCDIPNMGSWDLRGCGGNYPAECSSVENTPCVNIVDRYSHVAASSIDWQWIMAPCLLCSDEELCALHQDYCGKVDTACDEGIESGTVYGGCTGLIEF